MATTGLLSQAILNLQSMSQQLASLGGLPDNARGIETSVINLLRDEIPKVAGVQTTVKEFVNTALPSLQQAKADLDSGTNLDQVAAAIARTSTSAVAQKQAVDALNADINSTKLKIVDLLITGLSPIETQLTNQSITLNTELESAQRQAREIHNTEKYFLALSIFGLIGLAAAGIAMAVQEGKVNGLLGQVSSLRNQIGVLDMLKKSVKLVIDDLGDVLDKLSGVTNAVGFVAGDTTQIIDDLKNADGTKTKLYLLATISQVQTLGNDVA